MKRFHSYLLLGAVLLAVPVGADIIAKKFNQASSLGLDILLYEPVDFAYASIAVAGFSILGWSRDR